MPGEKRNPAQRLEDRNHIAFLMRTYPDMDQKTMAEDLNVSESTVSREIEAINKEWAEARVRNLDEAKQLELKRIDHMEQEAWQAWYESKQEIVTSASKKRSSGETATTESQKKVVTRTGDPRYMTVIQWCINKRCEILGLDAPKKIAPTNPDGTEPYALRVDDMTDLLKSVQEHKEAQRGSGS